MVPNGAFRKEIKDVDCRWWGDANHYNSKNNTRAKLKVIRTMRIGAETYVDLEIVSIFMAVWCDVLKELTCTDVLRQHSREVVPSYSGEVEDDRRDRWRLLLKHR